jgi:ubiquinone/menaquinone biosynthesis C-methylase UbiE
MMADNFMTNVCPVERAGGLDNFVRRLLQNPRKFLKPYIISGMTVLDLGCGPGFFSVEIAKLLNGRGRVIAADLQTGMLEKVHQKISGTSLEPLIDLHKCESTVVGLKEKVDFILAFYMIHEVPDQDNLFSELMSILKPIGKLCIVEPSFHVSRDDFDEMTKRLLTRKFEIISRPKIFMGRGLLLKASIV